MVFNRLPFYVVPLALGLLALAFPISATEDSDYQALARGMSLGTLAWVVLFAALASAALIEITKRILPIRGAFQLISIADWINGRAMDELVILLNPAVHGGGWHKRFARLATFDVPVEQLSARLGYVFDDIARNPAKAPELARSLYARGDPARTILLDLIARAKTEGEHGTALDADGPWFVTRRQRDDREALDEFLRDWSNLAGDVGSSVQTQLDGFQLATARAWRRYLTWYSIAVASLVGAVVSFLLRADGPSLSLALALCATIGTFLSWLVRDLTAGIERWRNRA